MNANFQSRPAAASATRLVWACNWFKRAKANARARRALAQVDARTLRDIGFTRRDLAVFTVATYVSKGSFSSGPR